jgi:hypothetical protein
VDDAQGKTVKFTILTAKGNTAREHALAVVKETAAPW